MAANLCHAGCNKCGNGAECRVDECGRCHATAHFDDNCSAEARAPLPQRNALEQFRSASETYWRHVHCVRQQDLAYQKEKETLRPGVDAMLVADFAPVPMSRRQLTQEETRAPGFKVLIIVLIEAVSNASEATTITRGVCVCCACSRCVCAHTAVHVCVCVCVCVRVCTSMLVCVYRREEKSVEIQLLRVRGGR